MIEIQRLATQALQIIWGGKNVDRALREVRSSASDLTAHQRASIQDGTYGVLRYRTELEQVLAPLFTKRLPPEPLHSLLLVATYQLLHTRLAPHAVVSQAVDTAVVMVGDAARGFANGVLRNVLRQKESLLSQAHATLVGQFSHPQWWIDRLQRDYPDRWQSVLTESQKAPPMTLRVNRRYNSVTQYQQNLAEQGLSSERVGTEGLRLMTPVAVTQLPGFERGLVSVQDASAQLAAALLGLHAGQRVLDACAAPGGKTAHMLELANLDVLALDKEPERVKKMRDDMQRLALTVRVECADAADPSAWWDGRPFDRILLDAPCSGSGVVRRHPDIKWLRLDTDILSLAEQQLRLLFQLWPLLKKGGRLVYATCSIFKDENGAVIARFLSQIQDAKALNVSELYDKIQDSTHRPIWDDGQVCPDEMHDGFYYAALQKV